VLLTVVTDGLLILLLSVFVRNGPSVKKYFYSSDWCTAEKEQGRKETTGWQAPSNSEVLRELLLQSTLTCAC
jgi:hypothetical protein